MSKTTIASVATAECVAAPCLKGRFAGSFRMIPLLAALAAAEH
jgi:hypothetical protein